MADAKETRRLEVLTIFAERLTAAGLDPPRPDELATIAAHPADWPTRVASPLCAAWSPTIEFLLQQVKFGVSPTIAFDQLPDELMSPSTELPTSEPTRGSVESPSAGTHAKPEPEVTPADPNAVVVAALMQWRARRIAEGADGAVLIKDVTLRNLVKFGHTDAEQIGKKLPGPAAYLGREIAAVIAEFTGPDAAPTQPAKAAQDAPTTPAPRVVVPPQPARQPRAVPPRNDERVEGILRNLTHRDFCDYEYGETDVKAGPLALKSTQEGLRLSYEPYLPEAGKMVIYRVVSADDAAAPFKPEAGDLVAVTTSLHVHDNRYLTCAVRHYQVWCHVGVDNEDARHNQPFLLAEGQEVSPVDDFNVTEDEGRVIGRWTTYPGTRSVRVYRIPLEGSTSVRDDPRNQICADQTNLTGFVDNQATRGMRYLYRALAEVTVGASVRLSRPRQQEILVSVVLGRVDDMEVVISEDNSRFDLTWTTPSAGQVRVYRISAPPPPGLTGSEMAEAALQVQGFDDEALIKDPVVAADNNRSRIAGVPWPTAWDRAYLTPVTLLGGKARIGTTKVRTRPLPPVTDAEIIERFDTEIITFGWPEHAAAVLVYVGSATLSPEEICDRNQPLTDISKSQYRRDGALILPRRLEPKGCTVCLVPVAFSRGEQVRGQITVLRYPGLHRLHYGLISREEAPPHVRELVLRSDHAVESPVAFVMVNNRERFPLGPTDGEHVYFRPPRGGEPTPQCSLEAIPRGDYRTLWQVDWAWHRGFFRLFIASVADRSRRYALADPSLQHLQYFDPLPGSSQ